MRGIAQPRNPRVSSHRWFRTRGVSARHHFGRTGRRDHPLVRCHPLPAAVTVARTNECSLLHFAYPREAHAPQSHHPVLSPSPSLFWFLPPCIPWMRAPRRQTGKRISESIKVADSIIRRARPRWHQLLVIGVGVFASSAFTTLGLIKRISFCGMKKIEFSFISKHSRIIYFSFHPS